MARAGWLGAPQVAPEIRLDNTTRFATFHGNSSTPPVECVVDRELFNEQVQIERKHFSFDLRENARGRFLRVTEDVGGRRDTVIIPAVGLERVAEIIGRANTASRVAGPVETE
mgnify:CR=1 FL=1